MTIENDWDLLINNPLYSPAQQTELWRLRERGTTLVEAKAIATRWIYK